MSPGCGPQRVKPPASFRDQVTCEWEKFLASTLLQNKDMQLDLFKTLFGAPNLSSLDSEPAGVKEGKHRVKLVFSIQLSLQLSREHALGMYIFHCLR